VRETPQRASFPGHFDNDSFAAVRPHVTDREFTALRAHDGNERPRCHLLVLAWSIPIDAQAPGRGSVTVASVDGPSGSKRMVGLRDGKELGAIDVPRE